MVDEDGARCKATWVCIMTSHHRLLKSISYPFVIIYIYFSVYTFRNLIKKNQNWNSINLGKMIIIEKNLKWLERFFFLKSELILDSTWSRPIFIWVLLGKVSKLQIAVRLSFARHWPVKNRVKISSVSMTFVRGRMVRRDFALDYMYIMTITFVIVWLCIPRMEENRAGGESVGAGRAWGWYLAGVQGIDVGIYTIISVFVS